jgi:hypothetical protein
MAAVAGAAMVVGVHRSACSFPRSDSSPSDMDTLSAAGRTISLG